MFRFPRESDFRMAGSEGYDLRIGSFNRPFSASQTIDSFADNVRFESTGIECYTNAIKALSAYHAELGEGKTVLSRIVAGHSSDIDICDVAEAYFDLSPNAFCLLARQTDGKIWIMATPELLLSIEGRNFSTVALAGTRKAGTKEEWDEKNRYEQRVVADYIDRSLKASGCRYNVSEPFTVKSNNIEHICTEFNGQLSDDLTAERLIDLLSPTPAVCGYPKAEALENIERYEDHRRGFYSGYTAVVNPDGTKKVYVNLRCACFDPASGRYAIFTGGGITAASKPEKELEETDLKAHTLQDLFLGKLLNQKNDISDKI